MSAKRSADSGEATVGTAVLVRRFRDGAELVAAAFLPAHDTKPPVDGGFVCSRVVLPEPANSSGPIGCLAAGQDGR